MPELTIKQIQQKARKGTLPVQYTIKSPLRLSSEDLIETLNCFNDNHQMLDFIDLLSENSEITILVNNKLIQQGSRDKFIHAYTNNLYPKELDKTKQNHIIAHLKSIQLPKKQLSYLLRNLNWKGIQDFLLVGNYFSEDLLELCQDFDELKVIPEFAIKILYHYFNVSRQWSASVTPLIDMYYFAYRAGHVLGLGDPVTMSYHGHQYSFQTGYAPTEVSAKVLIDYLDAYAKTNYSSPLFVEIEEAYRRNWQLLIKNTCSYQDNAAKTLLAQYQANKLIALTPGWDDHAVSISLRGDYLVYTNRGPCGDPRYGSKIFKIKAQSLIDEDFLKELMTAQSHTTFNNLLKRVIDFKSSVARFSSKIQKYDNCTFSNPKANIEALIVLLQTKPDASEAEIREVAFAERNRRKYKRFSNFMRNREIDELVKNMFYAQHPMLIQFYAHLVKQVIIAHHGQRNKTIKDRNDRARALDLFARTPLKIQTLIRQDSAFMATFDQIPKPAARKTPTGFLWRHIEYVKKNRGYYSHKVEVEDGYISAIDDIATPKMTFSYANTRRLCMRVLKNW
ncbi:hypothetical protein [Candidatus Berkiella aquae]|uniref:Uncharacterized protein n=1 Tax=Candidatus Berkiella aquae TaxID=295108 RepID=A0A0Q9YUC4_9GAMM|nr:hypothetical protein [Candidatus Berkiella aquae]MCS5712175.1 hypothetical protein [Candidatus Berkiella aquae]